MTSFSEYVKTPANKKAAINEVVKKILTTTVICPNMHHGFISITAIGLL